MLPEISARIGEAKGTRVGSKIAQRPQLFEAPRLEAPRRRHDAGNHEGDGGCSHAVKGFISGIVGERSGSDPFPYCRRGSASAAFLSAFAPPAAVCLPHRIFFLLLDVGFQQGASSFGKNIHAARA